MAKANTNQKPQSLYDVKVESDRIKVILERLSKEKPNTVDIGGKKDVISTVKKEIMALIKLGYTAQQIADAIKTDAFDILPKTITEIANKQKLKKITKKPKEPATRTESLNTPVEIVKPGSAQSTENNENDSIATDETLHNGDEQSPANISEQPTAPKQPDWMPKGKWNGKIYKGKGIYVDGKQFKITPEQEKELRALFPQEGE